MPEAVYTFDLDTPTGEVRLMIPDIKTGKMRFNDAQIAAFLRIESGLSKCAAALALETIASDTAMTLKYIETNAIKVDGSKPSDALLKRAAKLREQTVVAVAVVAEEEEGDEWDIVLSSCY